MVLSDYWLGLLSIIWGLTRAEGSTSKLTVVCRPQVSHHVYVSIDCLLGFMAWQLTSPEWVSQMGRERETGRHKKTEDTKNLTLEMMYHHFCHMYTDQPWYNVGRDYSRVWIQTGGDHWGGILGSGFCSGGGSSFLWAMKLISSSRCSLYSWDPLRSL